ncbi:ISL3 family transposase [Nonomuraea sp. NEAU-A123]|uniref:ISL3 family transposase n=1 Tax=Nonomuraea sp. NEAU-A123 TaxID=2839649 RepID=UPI001BE434FD|nr:ISL3 family transposase [Nonomuraea sp. NEAU-A123]MBT2225113.1 ISL3 family transposase [Nonomuraea sp. NEAU-A123]
MSIMELLAVVFPHLAAVRIERVHRMGATMRVKAATTEPKSACPACGWESVGVHSRYERFLSDLPVAGQEVLLQVRVRRFFCDNSACGKRTFAEQVAGLTSRHGRRAAGLVSMLRVVALALGGRPGARHTARLACAVGRSTLLRLLRSLPDPQVATPRVLGVDEFAWRKGHTYGTVLVDVEGGHVVDLLPDRSADSFAAWLEAHPGVEVICRDRAGCYAEGAQRGAPLAVQVADRWHLLHNLSGAVQRAVSRHRAHLREPAKTEVAEPPAAPEPTREEGSSAARIRIRHAEIHQALAQGMNITQISRELRLDRKTVRRYAAVTSADDLISDERAPYRTILDAYLPYLHQRWEQGCRSTDQLLAELRERGYLGSAWTLRRLTGKLRMTTAKPATPPAPKIREVTGWIVQPPSKVAAEDLAKLEQITARCPELASITELTRQFAEMLVHRRGEHDLESWAARAEASPARELRDFVAGLRRDWAAVKSGLTLPYSSGTVEGNVNRIKMIKRIMYGRANPDLLRVRVLHGY